MAILQMPSSVLKFHALWLFLISVACGNADLYEGSDGYEILESSLTCKTLNATIAKLKCNNIYRSRFNRYTSFNLELMKEINKIIFMFDYMKGSRINNRYPIPGAKFNISVCEMLKLNLWNLGSYKTTEGNLTDCPFKPGFYHITTSKALEGTEKNKHMPKNIPEGDYKAKGTLFLNDVPSFGFLSYVTYIPRKSP